MPNEQVFDEIVSPVANKQVQQLAADLATLDKQAIDTTKSINILNNATANSKTYNELKKQTEQVEKLQSKQEQLAAKQEEIVAKRRRIVQESTAQEIAAAKKNAEGNLAMTKATNALNEAQGRQAAKATAASAANQRYGQQYETTAKQVAKTTTTVSANTTAVETNTAVTVSGFAKVGAGLTKGLGYLRALAYILPGIGIAGIFNLAFTAISAAFEKLNLFNRGVHTAVDNFNNLNSVTKDANKQAGEQITNLRILYRAATDVSNSMHDRLKAAQELKREFPDTYKNETDLAIITGQLKQETKELTAEIYANAKAMASASKIQALAAQQLDVDYKKRKIISAKNAQIARVTPVKTLANGANSDAVAGFLTPEQQRKTVLDQQNALRLVLRDELREQDARRKSLDNQIEFLEAFAGGNNKIAKALSQDDGLKSPKKQSEKSILDERLKQLKLAKDLILDNEKSTYDERLEAIQAYEQKSYILLEQAEKRKTLTVLQEGNKLSEVDQTANKDRVKVAADAQKELLKIFSDGAKDQRDLEMSQITDIKEAQDAKLLAIEAAKTKAVKSLTDQYKQGAISAEEYSYKIQELEYNSAQVKVEAQIKAQAEIVALQEEYLEFGIGTDKELQRSKDELTKFQISASELAIKKELDGIKAIENARKNLHSLEKEIASASIDLIQTLVDGAYQNQLNALKNQSDQINKNAETEKAAVDNSLLSSFDKAQKQKVIDQQTLIAQERIAQQEKEIKNKQAKFDRIAALARIAQATAIAEVEALTYLSNPLTAPFYPAIAALIGALGAIQLATVLATPLPQYKDGGTTKGGKLIWGEAGTELATEPDGKQYLSPSTATIAEMPRGTVITPHLELMRMIKPDRVNYVGGQQVGWKEVVAAIERNKPKQKAITRININGDFDKYRKSYFR